MADLYSYFIERAVLLLREGGYFSYIVANKWLRTNYGEPLRRWLKKQSLSEIIDFGDLPVFKGATTYPCILTISKEKKNDEIKIVEMKSLEFHNLSDVVDKSKFKVKIGNLNDSGWNLVSTNKTKLLEKIFGNGIPLESYVNKKIFRGIITGLNNAFVIDEVTKDRLVKEDPKSEEIIKPFLAGRDIKRYSHLEVKQYLILFPKGFTNTSSNNTKNALTWLTQNYPAITDFLKAFEVEAKKRYDQGEYWWELRACDYYDEFEKPKIIYPNICKRNEFTFDTGGYYTNQKCFIIGSDDKFLLAILNSQVLNFLFQMKLPKLRGGFYEPSYVFIKDFPIPRTTDIEVTKKLAGLADEMLRLNNMIQNSKTDAERVSIDRQIRYVDSQIDQLVYKLYGLTDEEIKTIETK